MTKEEYAWLLSLDISKDRIEYERQKAEDLAAYYADLKAEFSPKKKKKL